MKKAFSAAVSALSFFIGGCAIHPVPQDVTGVDTYHIVRQIRCEARETIKQEVLRWLTKMASFGDPLAQKLVSQYESDPELISTFHYDLFQGKEYVKVRSLAKLFYDTGIAYNFDLTMTENNDLSTELSFLKPFTEPVFTLGVEAAAKRKRSNNRTFTVTDTFSYLLTKLNVDVRGYRYCNGQIAGPNYVYPIAGRIGIDKMVHEFVELTLFGSLTEPHAAPGKTGAPTMVDELAFTTTLSGSVNPLVVFTPVTNAFQLTRASLSAGAERSDIHKVIVGLAITATGIGELGPVRSYLFSSERGVLTTARTAGMREASPVVVGRRVTGSGRTPAEVLAVLAIDQQKSREIQLIPPP